MADEELTARVKVTGAEQAGVKLSEVAKASKDAAEDRTGTVTIKVDDKEVGPALARKRELAENKTSHVRIQVHDRDLTTASAKAKALDTQLVGLQGFGAKIRGLKFAGQGLKMTLGIPAALSAITPLVGGINSLAAGAVGLVAPLGQATNIIAAMPAAITPAAAAFGTFKLATMGVGDAIKDTVKLSDELATAIAIGDEDGIKKAKEQLDELTASLEGKFAPAALDFISLMPQMRVEMQELGKALQPGLFRGATDGLLGMREMLRSITPELGAISGALGGAAGRIGRQLGSADFVGNLREALAGAVPLLRTMEEAVSGMLDAFVTLGATAQPVMERIEGTVSRLVAGTRNWADAMTDRTLDTAYENFQRLWIVLRNTWQALGSTLQAFQPLGEWLLDTLGQLTQSWANWSKSITGQNALKEWADESKPVLEELGSFLADFAKMWARIGNNGAMADVIATLREQFLPTLEKIIVAAGETGTFEKLAGAIGNILTIIAATLGTSGVLGLFLDAVLGITQTIAELIDEFDILGSVIANFATSLALLKIIGVGGPIALGFGFLLTTVVNLTGSLKPLVPVVYAFAAAWATVKIAQAVNDLTAFIGIWRNVGPQLAIAAALPQKMSQQFLAAGGSANALAGAAGLGGLSIATVGVTAAVTAGFLAWQAWHTNVKRVEDETVALTQALYDGVPAMEAFKDQFQQILETRDSFDESFNESGLGVSQVLDAVNTATGELDELRSVWHELGEPVNPGQGTWDQFKQELEGLSPATRSVVDQLIRMREAGKISKTAFDETFDAIVDLDKEALGAAEGLDSQADAFRRAADEAGRLPEVEERLKAVDSAKTVEEKQRLLAQLVFDYQDVIDTTGLFIDVSEEERAAIQATNDALAAAKEKLDEFYAAQSKISSEKDFIKTQDDLLGKLRDVEETLKEGKGSFDANTDAGAANRDAIRELYDQYVALADGIYASTGDANAARGAYFSFVTEMERLGQAAGLSKEDMAKVREELGLTAKTWNADFELTIKDDQVLKLQYIESLATEMNDHGMYRAAVQAVIEGQPEKLDTIYNQGKWIEDNPDLYQSFTLEERRRLTEEGIPPSKMPDGSMYYAGGQTYLIRDGKAVLVGGNKQPSGWLEGLANWANSQQADGGIIAGYANGFLPKQAKIQQPRPNLIQWAEPETEGEAFIPLARSKRARSIAIWQETGRRLGVMADGGWTNNLGAVSFYSQIKSQTDGTEMKYPAYFVPPAHPTGGVGGSTGKGGSYQRIVDRLNELGIPYRNMGTWANRNVAGTNRKSLHAYGRAIDLGAPSGGSDNDELLRIYRALVGMGLTELIYSGPGGSNPRNPITRANHHNHVHAAVADGAIMPFARGGIVRRPTVGLVGESGPEAVVPLANGGILSMAAGGFSADTPEGQAAEAMANNWERLVSKWEQTDPTRAMKAIYERMVREQMQTLSDGWVQMYSRIERLQEVQRAQDERRMWNKWEDVYSKAKPEEQLRMAKEAQRGLLEWTDEWVAAQRRIDEAKQAVAAGGPAVYIANASFHREADIDALNRSVSWAVRTARL